MADQCSTFLTAALSTLVGGIMALLGVLLTNRSNESRLKLQFDLELRKQKSDLHRSRGEELYELTDHWLKALAGYYLRRNAVMQGKLTYNQCFDLDVQELKKDPPKFGRVEMLIDVYFPSTRSAYDKIIDCRTLLNKIAMEHERAYKDGDTDGSRFLRPYVECQQSIEKAGDIFFKQILDCIRAL
jgi:hypothetical protein